jgi:DMSO/TMAO reductase YedYZ molybdopterin-dependent catalytic subunit
MSDDADDAQRRIVAARLRLRERFLDRMRNTPAMADDAPQGSGEPNRHGMPKLPVGQTATAPGKWPVLDLGLSPIVPQHRWTLTLDGACRQPQTLDWEAFMRLEQVDDVSDFHCVTGWSRLDVPWRGVRFATVAALAEPEDDAEFVLCHAHDSYTTNLSLAEALKDDVLLVHGADGQPLPREHGGPVRLITPQLYAWKGAKWIKRIEFLRRDQRGFWELRGYSNSAHPWRNDRYSG